MTRISYTAVSKATRLRRSHSLNLTSANSIFPLQDIKPDNIFVDYDEKPDGVIEIKRVQVGDLEMGSVIPPGLNVRGARLGHPMWRSPEAHAGARINLPSDIFSFGLVVSVAHSYMKKESLNNLVKVHLYNASEDYFPHRYRRIK